MDQRLGLVLFILYIIQVIIGNLIHFFKPKSALRRRPPQNYFHAVLGLVIIATSFYQVHTGYKEEYPEITGRDGLPKAADIVFYVWVAVSPIPSPKGLVAFERRLVITERVTFLLVSLFLFCTSPAWRSSLSSIGLRLLQGTRGLTMR